MSTSSPRFLSIKRLALPGVITLISFLSYSSQYLFRRGGLPPGPPPSPELIVFNVLVGCIFVCYFRACYVSAGFPPSTSEDSGKREGTRQAGASGGAGDGGEVDKWQRRWCKKCARSKPPRAHHCKECKTCIPKMDHHCPWTANCVSHTTLPHFMRFVLYAVLAMTQLEYFLCVRAAIIWRDRALPSYLGPTLPQLIHLLALLFTNSITLFALATLLIRATYSLLTNTTTIEGWEIERHTALVRRARILGGYVHGPDGVRVPIRRQEFPYDVGFWRNMKAGMGGSANVLSWVWPFAATPSLETGRDFEINEFEDHPKDSSVIWPPPDPERLPRSFRGPSASDANTSPFLHDHAAGNGDSSREVEAFRRRQREDMKRWPKRPMYDTRDEAYEELEEIYGEGEDDYLDDDDDAASYVEEGEWTNLEGDRLRDFGVDEETEMIPADDDDDEENIPLGELLRRRKGKTNSDQIQGGLNS
ncbi:MAG: hypothetical protein M4579_004386 [Chaenotheca gracillima]|nr:MAG: hypothetical protein M4579_004386 [Chaenotheca gracillima]